MYLCRESRSAPDYINETNATVTHVTCRVEGLEHKLFMDNFFSSPRFLMIYWDEKYIHAGQYTTTEKTCPLNSDKKLKLTKGNLRVRIRGNSNALAWKDRQNVYLLTWTWHEKKAIFVMRANKPWSLKLCHGITGIWVTSTFLTEWQTAIRCVDVTSSGPRNCFSTFWI